GRDGSRLSAAPARHGTIRHPAAGLSRIAGRFSPGDRPDMLGWRYRSRFRASDASGLCRPEAQGDGMPTARKTPAKTPATRTRRKVAAPAVADEDSFAFSAPPVAYAARRVAQQPA